MKKQGFARGDRLRSTRDFQRVYREGRVFQDRYFRVFYREAAAQPQLGLVVLRRLGGAVARNRAKRIIREAFRLHKELFAGFELIVQLRAAAMALSNEELREQFLKVGTRLRPPA